MGGDKGETCVKECAQLGEHLPCKQGVKSSNLSISTRYEDRFEADQLLMNDRHQSSMYLENHILNISR